MAFMRSISRKYSDLLELSRLYLSHITAANSTAPKSTPDNSTADKPSKRRDPLDLAFEDAKAAFKSKTNWELTRAYIVYTLCSIEPLVDNNMKIMKIVKGVLGEKLFTQLMKATFYGHFVAGEDENKIKPVLERMYSFGVKPILDYSAEEDLSKEEAEKREIQALVPEGGDKIEPGSLKQFHVDKRFADLRYKVQSARTYFYLNEATCERNTETFLKCIQAVAGGKYGTGIIAIKLTALGRPQLLLQVSEVIIRARKYMTELVGGEGNVLTHHLSVEDLEKKLSKIQDQESVKKFLTQVTADQKGIMHLFPWSGIIDENLELSSTFRVPDVNTGRMARFITQLTGNEEVMFRNMVKRMNTIIKAAEEVDVCIMIDAEHSYFQPAIARITVEFMRRYNSKKTRLFNTYQCYLKNAFREITTDLEQAERQHFYFGAKLVRGAYLDHERARASTMGYEDPTNPTFDATTEMYHKVLVECLKKMKAFREAGEKNKRVEIMVASHNENTVRFTIQKMKEYGIEPGETSICFGQLLAMCDYLTFPLGQSGYSAYKYTPYGPVNEVMPYLSRRAQENKGVLKKIKKEKRLLIREILRRTITGQWWYTPKGEYTPV